MEYEVSQGVINYSVLEDVQFSSVQLLCIHLYTALYVKTVYCHPAYLTLCRIHHVKFWIDEGQAGIKIA